MGRADDPQRSDVRIRAADPTDPRKANPTASATTDMARRSDLRMTSTGPGTAPDDELLWRMRARDEGAFRELFARYAPVANGLAYRLVRQAQLAEEIVQEAFLSVWRHPERYDGSKGSVRSWLMGAVHNRAVDAVRREA